MRIYESANQILRFTSGGLILFLIFFAPRALCDDAPPFRDPRIPIIERSTYEVNEKGKTHLTIHTISRENANGEEVYVITTASQKLALRASNLTPLWVKQQDENGNLEFSIEYYEQEGEPRVRFVYPGPERNEVKEISEGSYDVNAIFEVLRGYPFDREKVKFTLVTADHVVGVYAKIKGEEKVTTPVGAFDCYLIETGVSGLKGKIIRTKFMFWIEKKHPHRLVQQKDSDGENTITLIGYEASISDREGQQ
jgi:hypothetical protein